MTEKEKENIRLKQWCKDNPEKRKEIQRKYYLANKDKILAVRSVYYKKNKTKIRLTDNTTAKNRKLTDPLFKLKCNIRRNVSMLIKRNGYTKKAKTIEILGCSFEDFKIHLEKQFQPWMNWSNYGKYNSELDYGWDIDHIIPLSSATNDIELLTLSHFSNLQPLCSYTNRYIKINNF